MPEINKQFTGGKMNKDVDERLVPSGEYRDAMNIQVSTSEGSDVGTVQNILGNKLVDELTFLNSNSTCVGSIADEKNDAFYWFVKETVPESLQYSPVLTTAESEPTPPIKAANYILEHKQGQVSIVFSDITHKRCFSGSNATFDVPASALTVPFSSHNFYPGDVITTIQLQGHVYAGLTMVISSVTPTSIVINFGSTGSTTGLTDPFNDVLAIMASPMAVYNARRAGTLKFPDRTITGINIIDGMLFWADGYHDNEGNLQGSEPKKINISRGIEGTIANGLAHTRLINASQGISIGDNVMIAEEHVTVIKRAPKNQPVINVSTGREENKVYSGVVYTIEPGGTTTSSFVGSSGGVENFSVFSVGDVFEIQIEEDVNGVQVDPANYQGIPFEWNVGSKIVIKECDISDGTTPPSTPITAHRIKGVIQPWSGNRFEITSSGQVVQVRIKIVDMDGAPPVANSVVGRLNYVIDLFDETEKLFEYKFPRFAYRYRYQDGEYSSFSPFSPPAFIPGSWDYHPKKGYNLGMVNRAVEIEISDFRSLDMPLDVSEIDILYKEDSSPNVYVVETLRLSDDPKILTNSGLVNNWQTNSLVVNSESIKATLPGNQLLRPWDNVPTKALAQEIVGNRLVYANYLQNYNLNTIVSNFSPNFNQSIESLLGTSDIKSIKSLREYQLGVVFADEYGRETPILTNSSGGFTVDKSASVSRNRIRAGLQGSYPSNMKFFKFFIKETSGEYYNLALERYYDAADGNVWLSFPSSDRNKLDIDTFLILKKGVDSQELVQDKARYNILAIENEAPDFIKTTKNIIAQETHIKSGNNQNLVFHDEFDLGPKEGGNSFTMDGVAFSGNAGRNMDLIMGKENVDLYVDFTSPSSGKSAVYRITEITSDRDEDPSTPIPNNYFITCEGRFGNDINFLLDNPANPLSATEHVDNITIRFWKYKVENSPQFDGRFFVKIYADSTFKEFIKTVYDSTIEYTSVGQREIAYMHSENGARNFEGIMDTLKGYYDSTNYSAVPGPSGNGNEDGDAGYVIGDRASRYMSFFQKMTMSSNWGSSSPVPNNGVAYTRMMPLGGRSAFNGPWTPYTWNTEDVWYIDAGTFRGDRWNNEWYHGGINDQGTNTTRQGLSYTTASSPHSRMHLSFGGITTAPDPVNVLPNSTGLNDSMWENLTTGNRPTVPRWNNQPVWASNNNGSLPYWDVMSMWNIRSIDVGGQIPNAHHVEQQTFADNIDAGTSFRWKEDPYGTIYTIFGDVNEKQILRYATTKVNGAGNTTTNGYNDEVFTRPANFAKSFGFTMKPSMFKWNPTENTEAATCGVVSDGVLIGINDNPVNSNNGTKLTVFDPFAMNFTRAQVTSNWTTMQPYIKIKSPLYPTASSMLGFCEKSGTVQPISPGMMVTGLNLSAPYTAVDFDNLIVDYIELQVDNSYHVYITGYHRALEINDFPVIADPASVADQTVCFRQASMNGYSRWSALSLNSNPDIQGTAGTVGHVTYTLEFLEPTATNTILPQHPAVWETEPKEEVDLDLYYEASGYIPLVIDSSTVATMFPQGTTVSSDSGDFITMGTTIANAYDNVIELSSTATTHPTDGAQGMLPLGEVVTITRPDGTKTSIVVTDYIYNTGNLTSTHLILESNAYNSYSLLNWYNCYSFGNGVESNRIRDNFNLPYISNGVKVSAPLHDEYKEEHRKHGLIYSGIYNSTSGINNLNQFIAAEKITKDVNPIYGSIQKLYSGWGQGGDLIALCEDRVLKILANKDALYNADGNTNITSTNNVLGQAIPYTGEYGISKNPESFASEAYRAYFTDKVRGTAMRLSMDGLTPISDHGMKDWFRDNLKLSSKLIGSYDDKKDEYNITLDATIEKPTLGETVSFREDVRGWVSFKSFVPENAISCANEYYTFKNGKAWKHHVESVNRNTFYNSPVANSSVTVLINDMPSSVKSFSTVNYEGSQARVSLSLDANGTIVQDGDYFNLTPLEGWFVDSAFTNLEKGGVSNFIEKEGKWFGFINGDNITSNFFGITTENFDTSDFSIQGIGVLNSTPTVSSASGCTDITAFNYQSAATIDDGSCYAIIYGCMDADAYNFIPLIPDILVDVNTSNGSCLYYGCTDPLAFNYDPSANSDDGSCVAVVYGCTNPTQFGFNPLANTDNGSCTPFVYGCMDDTTLGGCGPGCDGALNYNPNANTNDGSCTYAVPGCMNFDAWNYNSNATYQPIVVGTCKMCGDATANNYDYPSTYPIPDDYSGCIYCPATTGFTATASATVATEIDLQWDLPLSSLNVVNGGDYMVSVTNVVDGTTVNTSITPGSSGPYLTHTITGLLAGTDYSITIQAECSNTDGPTSSTRYATTIHIIGCMDGTGEFNGVPYAWPACNFNPLATSQTGGVVGYSASDCNYNCAGCMDANYAEFCNTCYTSPVGDFGTVSVNGPYIYDDGSCLTLISYGCTDVQPDIIQNLISYPYYTNFDNSAGVLACCTLCDGSDDNNCCTPTVLGCNDDSTINASSSTVIAATNYNILANTNDGSCVYPCPTLNQSGTNFSNATPPAPFSFNKITSLTNLSLTNYSANMLAGSGGLPSAYITTFKVTDNNGAVLYNNTNQGGFTNEYHAGAAGGAFWRHQLVLDFGTLNVTEDNHNSITCDMEITTNDGNCVVLKSNQYTIGCTDGAASNTGPFDFTDNTQCEYVGCTDSTLNNDGITYFATNYNDQATVACTDISGGYSAASSPSQDNACCTYPKLPTSEFKISHAYNMYANAYSDYSSLNVMENTVTGTAYTTAEITQFNVAGALLGWQASWIGGYATNASFTEAKWLDIPLNGSVNLTTIANYSTTGIVNHSTIPSNFDNRDLTYSPAYSGNLDNALAHNGLTIDYKVKFTATIINQSRANQIQHIVHNTQTFSGGCKTSTTNVYTAANSNLDPNWQMHIPGSCVLNPVYGCTTATAINYNPAATIDDGSCCLTCLAPTAFDVSNPTMVGGFATSVEVTFVDACEATSYTLYVQALSVDSNTVTAIQTISAPVGVGVTTIVPLSPGIDITYPGGEELTFTIETTCSDGSTSPIATSYLTLPLN